MTDQGELIGHADIHEDLPVGAADGRKIGRFAQMSTSAFFFFFSFFFFFFFLAGERTIYPEHLLGVILFFPREAMEPGWLQPARSVANAEPSPGFRRGLTPSPGERATTWTLRPPSHGGSIVRLAAIAANQLGGRSIIRRTTGRSGPWCRLRSCSPITSSAWVRRWLCRAYSVQVGLL